jgi:NAD(P)-dependent dehydrogenase (short-subunit alcohol dehydrogenase family)
MSTNPAWLRILITGAADGVGLECARAFAHQGSELILCDTDGIGLTRASDQLSAFSRYCDVASESSVLIFAAKIEEMFQNIDVLINAAGCGNF